MILIIGCSRLGGALATRLSSSGHEVTVLDHDRRHFDANLARGFQGKTIEGLEIDNAVLKQAGIERAEAVAAVARDESTNMMAADVAKYIFKVPRIVVRIDEPRMADVYHTDGFEVISPILAGATAFERVLNAPGDV